MSAYSLDGQRVAGRCYKAGGRRWSMRHGHRDRGASERAADAGVSQDVHGGTRWSGSRGTRSVSRSAMNRPAASHTDGHAGRLRLTAPDDAHADRGTAPTASSTAPPDTSSHPPSHAPPRSCRSRRSRTRCGGRTRPWRCRRRRRRGRSCGRCRRGAGRGSCSSSRIARSLRACRN